MVARDHVPDQTYRERLENYEESGNLEVQNKGGWMFEDYMWLFKTHGITKEKIQRWFRTLFSDNGKKNTIYMWGKSDAGKTTIIRLFDAFYHEWEVGRASAQNLNSNFWLQDLYEKRLFHCDEILATQINIDTLKLLLEGSTDLTTDIKYAKKVQILPKPVLMATNDPLWVNMQSAADPILRRCEYIRMGKPSPRGLRHLHIKDKEVQKYALHKVYKWCFPNGYDQWRMDNEMYETVFALEDMLETEVELMEPYN